MTPKPKYTPNFRLCVLHLTINNFLSFLTFCFCYHPFLEIIVYLCFHDLIHTKPAKSENACLSLCFGPLSLIIQTELFKKDDCALRTASLVKEPLCFKSQQSGS